MWLEVREKLTFVVAYGVHLVYIAATYQQSQFMMTLILVYEIQYMLDSI